MTRMMFRPVVAGSVQIEPLTVDEYNRMIESGELKEDTSIELIHGFLRRKNRAAAGEDPMTIGNSHTIVLQKLMRLAPLIEKQGSYLQLQQPIIISPSSEPEPDGSIILGNLEDRRGKPRVQGVVCVIEVADSSLSDDRGWKRELYASAGTACYVICNIPDHQVEVNTQPVKTSSRYRKTIVLRPDEVLKLPVNKDRFLDVPVEKLLP